MVGSVVSGDVVHIGFSSAHERIAWLDRLKIVAAFAVVVTHISSISWQVLPTTSFAWAVSSVYEVATRFCVPAFFFATGAILLNPNKRITHKRLVGYIARALVLALLVSALYVLLEAAFDGWQGWRYFISRTVDGPYFIWYLWALVGVYLLLPVLRAVASDHSLLTYTCVLAFIVIIGKSTAISMIPGSLIDVAYGNIIIINRGSEALFYCLLGGWFITHRFSHRVEHGIIIAGFASLAFALYLNWRHAVLVEPDLYYVARDNVLIALFSAAVFMCFSKWGNGRPLSRHETTVCQCGMAIYLVHPFFRLAFERLSLFVDAYELLLAHPLIMIPLVSLACYLLALFVGFVMRKFYIALSLRRQCPAGQRPW